MNKNRELHLLLGPALFAAALLLPGEIFTFNAVAAIGTIVWMACWWILLPVEPGITAFIPVVVNSLFGVVSMPELMSKYATDTFFLLLGADLIAISWEVTGLDKRLALKSLKLIGPSLNQQVVVWFVVSALLSAFLPNVVVCAMLASIAVSMLRYVMKDDFARNKAGMIILLAIAWGAGVGGLGTPLGGAMNLVAVDYIQKLIGAEFMYTTWILRMLPFLAVLILLGALCLMLLKPRGGRLEGTKEYFSSLYRELPPMSRDEKIGMILFIVPVALSFSRGLYAALLPELKPALAFIACGMMTFILRKQDGKPMLEWKDAQKKVLWGLIFMFGGGIAIGFMMSGTGAAEAIGGIISKLNFTGDFTMILVIVTFTMLLSEISSNTSAAAISIPIVISLTQGMGLDPLPYIYISIAAFNCAYMLPTSIRAIPVGYGLDPKYMFQKGFLLFAGSVLAVSALGFLLLRMQNI